MSCVRELEGFGKYVAIAGFRNVKITDVKDLLQTYQRRQREVYVQFFDAETIAGREHLFFAALNAVKVFENQRNISKSLDVETLLFASAQRQIRKAVELFGVKLESSEVVVLSIAETQEEAMETVESVSKLIPGEQDDSVIELTDKKIEGIKRLFNISDLELESKLKGEGPKWEALSDLVIEHVALLTI